MPSWSNWIFSQGFNFYLCGDNSQSPLICDFILRHNLFYQFTEKNTNNIQHVTFKYYFIYIYWKAVMSYTYKLQIWTPCKSVPGTKKKMLITCLWMVISQSSCIILVFPEALYWKDLCSIQEFLTNIYF